MDSGRHPVDFAPVLAALFGELALGSPDPAARTFVLNQGDPGLCAALDRLTAAAASAAHGGASIAAHVDHLRYGLSLLNRWADGSAPPWPATDWEASWRRGQVTEAEWRDLRAGLRREATTWLRAFASPRAAAASITEAGWLAGSVAHLAYHLGAIRQLDRAARGPTAADEARAQQDRATARRDSRGSDS